MNSIIVRYSEIGLKGNNKGDFEIKLVQNIRKYLKKNNIAFEDVVKRFSRIIVITKQKPDLSKIYGIASYSFAEKTEKDFEKIKESIIRITKDFNKDTTFRVSAKRLDKNFPLQSTDIEKQLGALIVEKTNAKVSLKGFENEVGVEIMDRDAYVFVNKTKGAGGLPVGIEGAVIALIEDNNSIKAARLMMKRGCHVFPVAYEEKSIEELEDIAPSKMQLHIIKDLKDIEEMAKKYDAKALIVGQTLKSFKDIKTKLLLLRPLIAE